MLPSWAWVLIALSIIIFIILLVATVIWIRRRRARNQDSMQQQEGAVSKDLEAATEAAAPQQDDSSSTITTSFKVESIKTATPTPDQLFKPLPAPPRKPRQNSTLSTNNLTTLIVQARQLSLSPFAAGSPAPERTASNPIRNAIQCALVRSMRHNTSRRMDHYEGFRETLVEYQRISYIGSEYERKQVYQIRCGHCLTILTNRGMNAVLLSDRSIQLFSTDLLPDTLGFVHGDYSAASCSCRVRDTACLTCGNIVGYHVNVPCKVCLSQPNNGHYWMFRSADIKPFAIMFERLGNNDLPLLWGFVYGAGEFNGKNFRSGNLEGAHQSCQLSVKLPWHLRLIVHSANFLEQVEAVASDEDSRDLYAEVCR